MPDPPPYMPADTAVLVRDSHWHAHRYDAAQDAFQFRHVAREQHRRATFLTDEYLGETDRIIPVPRQQVLAAVNAGGATFTETN